MDGEQRVEHGLDVVGRPGGGAERPRERHDQHAIRGTQVAHEARHRVAQEADPVRDALAAVDQHHVGGRHDLGPDHLELLPRPVFLEDEAGLAEAGDRPAGLVVHGRLDQHADHLGLLDEVEGGQLDAGGRAPALGVGDLDRDHGRRERVVVDPLDGVDRAVRVLPDRPCR